MKSAVRAAAWLLLAAIVILSVVPAQDRPVTPAPHNVEHLAAFVLAGVAFGFGYPPYFVLQVLGLVLFCAAIEIAQLAVPGRHARFSDFLVDALGVMAGVGFSAAAIWGKDHIIPRRADE